MFRLENITLLSIKIYNIVTVTLPSYYETILVNIKLLRKMHAFTHFYIYNVYLIDFR